jgi:hypothetical protein
MMRTLLLASAATLLATAAQAQIPNGGFENWTSMGTYMDPDSWITINALTALGGSPSCEQGSPGAVGAHYAKVTTRTITGIGTIPGVLISGDAMSNVDGFPYTTRPSSLTGKVQYSPVGTDMGLIAITMSKWNTVTGQRDAIGQGTYTAVASISSWTTFSAAITYTSPDDPDTATISIISGTSTTVAGSSLWVDDLGLSTGSGIAEASAAVQFSLYPSPATDLVQVNAAAPLSRATILDMEGRTVHAERASSNQLVLSVADLPAGLYTVEVRTADGRVARKRLMKD